MADAPVRALILAGGSGTRLWPRSTDARPKPFLALAGGESLLREAYRRAAAVAGGANVWVSGRAAHAALLEADLPEVPEARFVLEPIRRNTAPAIALSTLVACADDPDAVVVVLPSDQAVADEAMFLAALRAGAAVAAREDAIVTLGIPPTRPETGYGYMEMAEGPEEKKEEFSSSGREKDAAAARTSGGLASVPLARRVARFVEKPDAATAAEFLASGRFVWNAGIFLFRASLLFEELARTTPAVLDAARRAFAAHRAGDLSSFAEILSSSPSVSIDVALMEKARRVLTIPCPCGWSDLGSWEAVFEFRGGAPGRDVVEGDASSEGGSGNLVLAGTRPVRVVGLSGVAVVESPDGLLVMRLGASDELRRAVERGLAR
ncbi:MAG TPA: sugar phosphate nucleotidyltransferase [Thermoanaerobaculia bacterium]|nr:sugar phosphate nucleotidyltransferase [Thermoanaerobaculia bacterium]